MTPNTASTPRATSVRATASATFTDGVRLRPVGARRHHGRRTACPDPQEIALARYSTSVGASLLVARTPRATPLQGGTMPQRVLVQAGHQRPLQPGHEGQTGAPGEAELVARIQRRLVRLLNEDGNFSGIA